jgi:hypothetical protein
VEVPQETKIKLPYDTAIPLLRDTLKEWESSYNEGTCTPCLLQHYSQYLSYGNSQDASILMNGLRKCDIYIQWNFIHIVEWNFVISR